jgi:drug/metabolite transporter (DMT)-like permease
MSHRRAVALMVLVTLLWSIAGVVTRQLEVARSFEVTFWRSAFNALALAGALSLMRGPALWRGLLRSGRAVWISSVCWAVMFTAFMLALTMTTVANVLVTMAIGPMITALFSRFFLGKQLPARTWLAILVAGAGIAWMFGLEVGQGGSLLGMLVASAVPLAGAVNWTVLQRVGESGEGAPDMLPAVLIGALLSALFSLPLAWPLQASGHDLGLLALVSPGPGFGLGKCRRGVCWSVVFWCWGRWWLMRGWRCVNVDAVEKPFSSPIFGKNMAQVFSAPFCIFIHLNWSTAASCCR